MLLSLCWRIYQFYMDISLHELEIMLPCLLDIWCTTLSLVCVLRKLIKITTDKFWSYGTGSVYWSYHDIGTVKICGTLKHLSALSS